MCTGTWITRPGTCPSCCWPSAAWPASGGCAPAAGGGSREARAHARAADAEALLMLGITFGRPELLWLAPALAALVFLGLLLYARRRRRAVAALGDPALVRRLGAGELARFPWARLTLLLPAAAALGLAVADPRWGAQRVESHSSSFSVA